jgi:hypothetical protein
MDMGPSVRPIPILRSKLESRSAFADFESAKMESSRRVTSEVRKSYVCPYFFAQLVFAKVMLGTRLNSPQGNMVRALTLASLVSRYEELV